MGIRKRRARGVFQKELARLRADFTGLGKKELNDFRSQSFEVDSKYCKRELCESMMKRLGKYYRFILLRKK